MLQLAGALHWFWYIRGYKSEGRALLERVLQQSTSAAAPARAKVLLGAARLQSDLGRANTLFEQSLALWRDLADKSGLANTLLYLGRVTLILWRTIILPLRLGRRARPHWPT